MKSNQLFMYVVIGVFLCFSIFLINPIKGYAATNLKVPEITKFTKSTSEKNALNVTIKSNNTGTNYSFELLNTTTGKINVLSGNTTSYTYQNLKDGTYNIQIRACTNDKNTYSCSSYSAIKSATLGSGDSSVSPTIKSAKLSKTSYNCNGTQITPTVTIIDSNNKTLVKDTDYKVTYPSERRNVGTYTVVVNGINSYSFEKKLTFKIKLATPYIIRLQPTGYRIDVNSFDIVYFVENSPGGNQISYKKSSAKKWTTYKNNMGIVPNNWETNLLIPATKYDVRVRNYVTVNGKKKYSSWSKIETIKTLPRKSGYSLWLLTPTFNTYSYKYDGKNKKPTLKVVDYKTKAELKSGVDYTASFPKTSKNVGTYTVTVKGKGNYAKNYPQYLKYRIVK